MSISRELSKRSKTVFKNLSDERKSPKRFNPFDPEDVKTAALIGLELALEAEDADSDDHAITQVLDLAEARAQEFPHGLVQHGLALFATHTPKGRLMGKPRMLETLPRAVVTGRQRAQPEAAFGPEAALDYWRENALANEHHQHWHEVYPSIGVVRPIADIPVAIVQKVQTFGFNTLTLDELAQVFGPQDRHGELFVYMHQQMLARYDAERLSHGLDPVIPLDRDNLGNPVVEAFDPGPSLDADFDPRPANAVLSASDVGALSGMITQLRQAIADNAFQNSDGTVTAITPPILGDQIEAVHAIHRGKVDPTRYGNLHNSGHGAISQIVAGVGVMASTATAIRDPIFFRWHKLIDDLAFDWQDGRAALDLADAPPVTFAGASNMWASEGIVMLDTDSLPNDADAAVTEILGGAAWATQIAAGDHQTAAGETITVVDSIQTEEKFANFPDPETPGNTVAVSYLAHDPISYAFRLENTSNTDQGVTIRLFLCPQDRSDDRRFWIELDKLPVVVPAQSRTVVLRHDRESAVVKKPAEPIMSPDLLADADGDPRCDCGWPYTLLYPRGTEAGMGFRLMAVLSDAALDSVSPPGTCGSLSFCGARDARFPDLRDMGYPFHVPWDAAIGDTIAATSSMAGRNITIRHAPFGSN